MNLQPTACKAAALPLRQPRILLVGMVGFEPTAARPQSLPSTTDLHSDVPPLPIPRVSYEITCKKVLEEKIMQNLTGHTPAWDFYWSYLRCATSLLLERDKGFEPSLSAWKAEVLAVKH